jgi:hypothetical protein
MQIIRDDDRGEASTRERPGPAFQIGLHELRPWDQLRLAVDRDHLEAALGEENGVPP